ncbi:MAG TPA: tyrosine-type recombinase/integrase, partial [Anaerolineaceae bacterium]|nr:tyrosine-type recombinase/integrase [Anaerolineaceae bacterium]
PAERNPALIWEGGQGGTISHRVKGVMAACGIVGHRLHDLRHTAATYMLKNGIDIRTVQKILGHAAISTTTIYADVLTEMLKSEMSKLRFE